MSRRRYATPPFAESPSFACHHAAEPSPADARRIRIPLRIRPPATAVREEHRYGGREQRRHASAYQQCVMLNRPRKRTPTSHCCRRKHAQIWRYAPPKENAAACYAKRPYRQPFHDFLRHGVHVFSVHAIASPAAAAMCV